MKIRIGFVSNSSSSSFCMYGKIYNDINVEEFVATMVRHNINLDRIDDAEDGNWVAVGLHPSAMRDDETAGEFKRRIKTELTRLSQVLQREDAPRPDWICEEYSY
jgi:hypothetical protein